MGAEQEGELEEAVTPLRDRFNRKLQGPIMRSRGIIQESSTERFDCRRATAEPTPPTHLPEATKDLTQMGHDFADGAIAGTMG